MIGCCCVVKTSNSSSSESCAAALASARHTEGTLRRTGLFIALLSLTRCFRVQVRIYAQLSSWHYHAIDGACRRESEASESRTSRNERRTKNRSPKNRTTFAPTLLGRKRAETQQTT